MQRISLVLLAAFAIIAFAVPATAQTPKKKGQTIFGVDRKATMKAMRGIAKSLGVKCTFCHVKEGGKVVYSIDTDHKRVARQMKSAFIDSLVAKGTATVSFPEDGKTMTIQAVYKAEGEDAGIHLSAQAGEDPKHEGVVDLPPEGEALSCMTCHGRKVHILTSEEEDKK